MRRKDREITDKNKIEQIIRDCHCCRLGFSDEGRVYLVPLSFGYEEKDGRRFFYFHGAKEGRKIDLIRKTHYAAFELDTNYKLKEAAEACSHSARFQSIFGEGKVDFIEDMEEKKHALSCIMAHTAGKYDWDFSEPMLKLVAVFRLEVEELSCKEHE